MNTLRGSHASGQGGRRTHDTRIFSPLLYYLSYLSLTPVTREENVLVYDLSEDCQFVPHTISDSLTTG